MGAEMNNEKTTTDWPPRDDGPKGGHKLKEGGGRPGIRPACESYTNSSVGGLVGYGTRL